MPHDFQALPPLPPTPPPSSEARHAQISFRKPDKRSSAWRWVIIGLFIGCVAFVLWETLAWPARKSAALKKLRDSSTALGPSRKVLLPATRALWDHRLEGAWVATALVIDGIRATPEDVATVRVVINRQGNMGLSLPSGEWSGEAGGLFVKAMTFIVRSGPEKGLRVGKITVRSEGDGDILWICVNWTPAETLEEGMEKIYPHWFTPEKGSGCLELVMKRQEKEP